uniref:Wsv206-like protein, paralog 2 n=1 Tax=Marsupenaeus japonicus endogenous nimavirus TaxID=2133793 RepID=A0A401IP71_9VIRU|nr:wsv206-like protein, paralog 2 [Marsupenaeus japonicus endogenous nimavirus]
MAENPRYLKSVGDIFAPEFRKENICICQQCNCVAMKPHGLSKSIADTFGAYTNPYGRRKAQSKNIASYATRSDPGTIEICKGVPCVANFFGQYMYGKPGEYQHSSWDTNIKDGINKDTSRDRELYFEICLNELYEELTTTHTEIDTVVFPYNIGCGPAGGNWTRYEEMISRFADRFTENGETNSVRIVEKPDPHDIRRGTCPCMWSS